MNHCCGCEIQGCEGNEGAVRAAMEDAVRWLNQRDHGLAVSFSLWYLGPGKFLETISAVPEPPR